MKKSVPTSAAIPSLDGLTGRFAGYSLPQAQAYFQEFPGAAPQGTGATGLASNDAQGYSDLLNLRDAVMKAQNPQTTIRTVEGSGSDLAPGVADNPGWWTGGTMAPSLPQESADEDAMPPSLRPLYRSSFLKSQKA